MAPAGAVDLWGDALPRGAIARLGTVRLRVSARARALATSADRGLIASGHEDGLLRVFDAAEGELLFSAPAHRGGVNAVAFLGAAHTIVTGGADGYLRRWDPGAKKMLSETHPGEICALAVSPDGATIVVGAADGTVSWWPSSGERATESSKVHTDRVGALVFSADGRYLVSGGWDGLAVIRDLAEKSRRIEVRQRSPIQAMTASAYVLAVGGADGVIRTWALYDGSALDNNAYDPVNGGVTSLQALDPTGVPVQAQDMMVTGGKGEIGRWLCHHLHEISSFGDTNGQPVAASALLGDRLVTAGAGGVIRLWNAYAYVEETPRQRQVPHKRPDPSGAIDTKGGGHTARVRSIAFSPDGESLVSSADDRTVRRWSRQGAEQMRWTMPSCPAYLALFTDAGRSIGVVRCDGVQHAPDASGYGPEYSRPPDATFGDLDWVRVAPDGRRMIQVSKSSGALTFSTYGAGPAGIARKNDGTVKGVAFLGGGQTLSITVQPDKLAVRDVVTSSVVLALRDPGPVSRAAMSPDGKVVFIARPQEVEAIDTVTGLRRSTRIDAPQITELALSPDGTRLLAVSGASPILLEASTLAPVAILVGHEDLVTAVAFSPDGSRLATGSEDTTILIWQLR